MLLNNHYQHLQNNYLIEDDDDADFEMKEVEEDMIENFQYKAY